MTAISFLTPAALLLLLLLPLLWALPHLAPRRAAPRRTLASLVVRSLIAVALIGGLAGAQLVREVRDLTTVFVLDASDSLSPTQRVSAERYVNAALVARRPGDLAAVVVFGEQALVERAPGRFPTIGRINSVPVTSRTNIHDALNLAMALFPAELQKRIVLVSDGGENSGRAIDAARVAAVRGIPIDVVSIPGTRGDDVLLEGLTAPGIAREGQQIGLTARVRSSIATSGELTTLVDGAVVSTQQVTIPAGSSSLTVSVPAGSAGARRIELRLDATGDTEAQNNRGAAFTDVQGPPRILLIASDAARARPLAAALTASGVRPDIRAPAAVSIRPEDLDSYAAIGLIDTPARDLPRPLIDALGPYVQERGRGLLMVGGPDGFGAGGYRRTKIEPLLPVRLDPLDTSKQPDLALVMVIDRSGSMAEAASQGGRSRLDVAKEAVYQAALGLGKQDKVGIVGFDSEAQWVMQVQPLPPIDSIANALGTFGPGGGTDIRSGIALAADALAKTDAKIKHVLLLTDGYADSNYSDLVRRMRADGVTISTFAIGSETNLNLQEVAQSGGGRFYQVARVEDVPAAFLQETVIVAGRDIVEKQIAPVIALRDPILPSDGALPPVYGYNGTEQKETARTILVTPDAKPLLAQEQIGLGRSVAWTSDLRGGWGRDWVTWDGFVRFAGGLANLLIPPRSDAQLNLTATADSGRAVVELRAQDASGAALDGLTLDGRLRDPQDAAAPLSFTQVGPGRYRASAPATDPGVYLVQLTAQRGGEAAMVATTGLVVSYALEYSAQRDNPQLLADIAAASGGRVEPPAASVFDPQPQPVGATREIGLPLLWLALLLWPLDIAIRRLTLRRGDLLPRRATAPVTAAADAAIGRLSAAKQRAQRPQRVAASVGVTQTQTERGAPPPLEGAQTPVSPATPTAEDAEMRMARLLAAKQRARKKKDI